MEANLYQINAVIAVLFVLVYTLLMHALIGHMREMVRLKYHVDERAEFDESRVKIVIGIVGFLWLIYVLIWALCLFTLDPNNQSEYEKASALFKAITGSLLVGAYIVYFINNRIKKDIEHVKRTVRGDRIQVQSM